MLLLINRRYPAFGFVLGLIAALISIVIGVAIGQATFIVMGVGSLAHSFARLSGGPMTHPLQSAATCRTRSAWRTHVHRCAVSAIVTRCSSVHRRPRARSQ
jgi:hypothetical protein